VIIPYMWDCAGACSEGRRRMLQGAPAHAPRCAGACSEVRRRMLRACAGACSELAPAHVPSLRRRMPGTGLAQARNRRGLEVFQACSGACSEVRRRMLRGAPAHAPACAGACSEVRRSMLRGAPAHAPSLRRSMFRGPCILFQWMPLDFLPLYSNSAWMVVMTSPPTSASPRKHSNIVANA